MPTTAKSPEEFAQRFWSKVEKTDGCWNWIGARTPAGYGNLKHQQKTLFAHRISYDMAYGDLADKDLILHSCDNRACVRPDHLSRGDYRRNSAECSARGRNRKEGTKCAKMTAELVREMRRRYEAGETQRALAEAFNLTQSGVSHIVLRKTWDWVD